MTHKLKKYLLSLSLIVLMLLIYNTNVYAISTNRIDGLDRFETSIQVSKNGWDKSDYIIIANGLNFPDALSASPLAGKYDCPIILVNGKDLTNVVKDELKRLDVKEAFIIGGPSVVSESIESNLQNMNIKINRYYGKDRYETSVEVARHLDQFDKIVLVNGLGFADALSIAPIAAKKGMPILLTPANSLPNSVSQFLNDITNNDYTQIYGYFVGGYASIGDNIRYKFKNMESLGGYDRYSTNIAVLNHFNDKFKYTDRLDFSNIYMVGGQDFPDALSASALAQKNNSIIILSNKITTFKTEEFLNKEYDFIKNITVVGGTGAVSDSNIDDILFNGRNNDSNGNLQNLGLATKFGEDIYYKEHAYGYIYHNTADGDHKYYWGTTDSYFLNVFDGWVYYADTNGYISRRNLQGSYEKTLRFGPLDYMKVSNNYIYYTFPDPTDRTYKILYKTNLFGDDLTPLRQLSAEDLTIHDSWTYYINAKDKKIYKFNLNDPYNEIQVNDTPSYFMVLDGEWIYYINNLGNIGKVKIDGSNNSVAFSGKVTDFNVQGDYIYYSNYQDGYKLYRLKKDGTENKKLVDEKAFYMNLAGGWIFYLNGLDENAKVCMVRTDGTFRQVVR